MKKQVQVQLDDLNDSRQQVQKLFGKFEELLDVKVKQQQQEQQQTKTQKIEDSPTTFDACLNKVTELERKQQMIARSSALSSSTKRSLSHAIAVNAEKYAKKAARLCSDLDTSSSHGTASIHHGVTSNKKKNTPPHYHWLHYAATNLKSDRKWLENEVEFIGMNKLWAILELN